MKTLKIRKGGGSLVVNLDMVCTIEQTGDGRYLLRTQDGKTIAVIGPEEYDSIMAQDTELSDLRRAVQKLTEAVERLSVRMPSSLRVHF